MRMLKAIGLLGLAIVALGVCRNAAAETRFEAQVTLRNTTGEDKADWPVFLQVRHVFGGDLKPGMLSVQGFHVADASGAEVRHTLVRIPPAFSAGNDLLVVLVPKLAVNGSLTLRITNDANAGKTADIDLVGSKHNLVAGGGFEDENADENGKSGVPKGWHVKQGAAHTAGGAMALDAAVKRSGKQALRLTVPYGTRIAIEADKPVQIKKGVPYYFSFWAKSDGLMNNGWGFWNEGGVVSFSPDVFVQEGSLVVEATRDWYCYDPRRRMGGTEANPWEVDEMLAPVVSPTRFDNKEKKQVPNALWAADGKTTLAISAKQGEFPFIDKDKPGRLWVDDMLLFEQPEVTVERMTPVKQVVKDGAFVFTRPVDMWSSGAFPQEAAEKIEAFAMKGERRRVRFGVQAVEPLKNVEVVVLPLTAIPEVVDAITVVKLEGDALDIEMLGSIETKSGNRSGGYVVGYAPVAELPAGKWTEYILAVDVPADAKPGIYAGTATIKADGKVLKALPLELTVLPVDLPKMKDYLVGPIYNGGFSRSEDFYRLFGKMRLNYLMYFADFFPIRGTTIDFAKPQKEVDMLMKLGHVGEDGGIGLYRETNMSNDQPRTFYQAVGGGKETVNLALKEPFMKLVREVETYAREHHWPRLVHMVTDEPEFDKDRHDGLGWVNEAVPDAYTVADAMFGDMLKSWQWYNIVSFDDPADWTGPQVYQWARKQGKRYGFCGNTGWEFRAARYQTGLMLASSGGTYWHSWHLSGSTINADKDGKLFRKHVTEAWAEGFNDLRYYVALRDLIAKNQATAKKAVADEAQKYLDGVFAWMNADHSYSITPYNGLPSNWGADAWFDDWRAKMKDYILKLSGQ